MVYIIEKPFYFFNLICNGWYNVMDDYRRQTKQFITEEKMAAHFKSLHISSNYQQSSVPSTSTADSQPVNPRELNMELELDAANADQIKTGPRLVLSEELKRIQQEPILPNSLLSKLWVYIF